MEEKPSAPARNREITWPEEDVLLGLEEEWNHFGSSLIGTGVWQLPAGLGKCSDGYHP